jgi:hypothetical protein
MPATSKVKGKDKPGGKEIPPVFLALAAAVVLMLVGLGGYYVYNGGWKTQGQLHDEYVHQNLPLIAAKHGDMDAFNAENALRRKNGQPLLELPNEGKKGN